MQLAYLDTKNRTSYIIQFLQNQTKHSFLTPKANTVSRVEVSPEHFFERFRVNIRDLDFLAFIRWLLCHFALEHRKKHRTPCGQNERVGGDLYFLIPDQKSNIAHQIIFHQMAKALGKTAVLPVSIVRRWPRHLKTMGWWSSWTNFGIIFTTT